MCSGYISQTGTETITQKIQNFVKSKKLNLSITGHKVGPTYTRFYAKLGSGTDYQKIKNLAEEMAKKIDSPSGYLFVSEPIPGTDTFGVDVPNEKRQYILLAEFLQKMKFDQNPKCLNIPLGVNSENEYLSINLYYQPHLLIAGTEGSGKSSYLNSIINTLLIKTKPEEVKLILIDTKRTEFGFYEGLPNLLCPVINKPENAVKVFSWLDNEMNRRYSLFEKREVRNIAEYNEKFGFRALPYILVLIHELGDIVVQDPSEVERNIIILAQLARATGIHLILATQRPSSEVITNLILANIPSRMVFNTVAKRDSMFIIHQEGAERLLGKGDLLYVEPHSSKPVRVQTPYIEESEIKSIVNEIKSESKSDYDIELMGLLG